MTAQHNASMNPATRPTELLALQQRRALGNITNGEPIRPPAPTPAPTTPEPPKPFSPRTLPPQPQRHGPFYGHNPNLKLPPDLFLLGCIFVVVEVERYLEKSAPEWRQVIEKHGGEVELVYCTRVTHVLCETQRHGVVMQALRDFKRCVTLYWLNDVVERRQVRGIYLYIVVCEHYLYRWNIITVFIKRLDKTLVLFHLIIIFLNAHFACYTITTLHEIPYILYLSIKCKVNRPLVSYVSLEYFLYDMQRKMLAVFLHYDCCENFVVYITAISKNCRANSVLNMSVLGFQSNARNTCNCINFNIYLNL